MDQNQQSQTQQPQEDKMTILKWKAPSRLFKKRDRVFFQTVIALVFLVGMILFLMKEFLAIGVVLAIAFVVYVLETVPPEEIEHRITVKGFEVAGLLDRWEEFSEFWFDQKRGHKMVVLQKKYGFPTRIIALLGFQDEKSVKEKINEYIPFRETPEKNWTDLAADWLHKRFPFERA